jgi:hypothetical protein
VIKNIVVVEQRNNDLALQCGRRFVGRHQLHDFDRGLVAVSR